MNKLLNLIASHRFERYEDQGCMALAARKRYEESVLPLLEKAFPNEAELDQLIHGISDYVSATELSAYLDGLRDGAEILCASGARGY